jgi:hypothetical protein
VIALHFVKTVMGVSDDRLQEPARSIEPNDSGDAHHAASCSSSDPTHSTGIDANTRWWYRSARRGGSAHQEITFTPAQERSRSSDVRSSSERHWPGERRRLVNVGGPGAALPWPIPSQPHQRLTSQA